MLPVLEIEEADDGDQLSNEKKIFRIPPTLRRRMSEPVCSYMTTVGEELKTIFQLEGLYEPELVVGLSEILDIEDVVRIKSQLSSRQSWQLAYSTSLQKHTLSEMYKQLDTFEKMNKNDDFLIMIKDKSKFAFGALVLSPQPPQAGTLPAVDSLPSLTDEDDESTEEEEEDDDDDSNGRSIIMFHCRPFRQFSCCLKKSNTVIKKDKDVFHVGCKGSSCGLWLNGNFTEGIMHEADLKTFTPKTKDITVDPEILKYKFDIKAVECWTFSYAAQKCNYVRRKSNVGCF